MNKSQKRTNVILLAFVTILLCVATITAGTFALFTDTVTIKNHLVAGTLDLQLVRTNLVYTELDADGYLTEKTDSTDKVLNGTSDVDENVFGLNKLNGNSNYIVPTSYFVADMAIVNNGNVAFDYTVEFIVTEGNATELAKQLKVTFTDTTDAANPVVTTKTVEAIGSSIVFKSEAGVKAGADDRTFTLKVEFENLTEDENNKVNNDLEANKTVKFDVVVKATQAVKAQV